MKRNNNKIYAMMLMLGLAAASMTSCSDDDKQSNLYSAVIPSSVEFNLSQDKQLLIYTDATGAKCLPMVKGETLQLEYTMLPEDITSKDVVWSASNNDFATVSDNGLVTAVDGDGYSIVQIAPVGLYEGSGINANLKVVVSKEMRQATSIAVTSDKDEIYSGDNLQMTATIAPDNSTYKTVKWSVDDENAASIDPMTGVLTGKEASAILTPVKVIATALDGSGVVGEKTVNIRKVVAPEDVTIDQTYSADKGYVCALNEKSLNLNYTTVPAECTTSQIVWTSSDENVATVADGVVTFKGFGTVEITATTPATGKSSTIKLNIPAGLIRETFHNENHYSIYDAKQSGNGTSTSHEWHDGYLTITTYKQNATNQRADLKWYDLPVTLHAGNYPIIAVKMDDVKDLESGITSRNLNFDIVGKSESGKNFKALGGGNNKYSSDYKCSDGSHVFVYDLSKVAFGTGGIAPTNEAISFTVFQLKHADIKTVDHQLKFNLYWFQSFKSMDDLESYIKNVDGLTFEKK
mgnify:FL=1|jgi:uncharacterized protein YjdB